MPSTHDDTKPEEASAPQTLSDTLRDLTDKAPALRLLLTGRHTDDGWREKAATAGYTYDAPPDITPARVIEWLAGAQEGEPRHMAIEPRSGGLICLDVDGTDDEKELPIDELLPLLQAYSTAADEELGPPAFETVSTSGKIHKWYYAKGEHFTCITLPWGECISARQYVVLPDPADFNSKYRGPEWEGRHAHTLSKADCDAFAVKVNSPAPGKPAPRPAGRSLTQEDWAAAHPRLKKVGGELKGPCPNPLCPGGPGKDRFYVRASGKAYCRKCCPDGTDVQAFKALLEGAGFDPDAVLGGYRPEHRSPAGGDAPKDAEGMASEEEPKHASIIDHHSRRDWPGDSPPRGWICRGWLPAGRVVMLSGDGGVGKSRLALQLACAVAAGGGHVLPPKGALREAGPVVDSHEAGTVCMVGWEDELDETDRRIGSLRRAGVESAAREAIGDRLVVVNAATAKVGSLWGPEPGAHVSTKGGWTDTGGGLMKWIHALDGIRLVVIDPLAAAFGGNENDRALVRDFLTGLADWTETTGAAVLLVAHPAKAAAGASARYSGTTDWRNGVRALWTLRQHDVGGFDLEKGESPPRGVALTLDKSSYSGVGTRAWLANSASGDGGMAWIEVTAQSAAENLAMWQGNELPPVSGAEVRGASPRQGSLIEGAA